MVEKETENPLAKRGPGRPKEPKQIVESETSTVGDTDEIKLTGKELKALKALLSGTQTASAEKSQDGIVEALIIALRESQKPYKSDAEKENDRRQNEQMRDMARKKIRNVEIEQTYCKHMAGTNQHSDVPSPANAFTAIAWHDITNQLRWGICTVCQRQFWPTDSDYRYWRQKPSFNKLSKAGERDNVDIQKWASEEHPEPFGTVTGVDPAQFMRQQFITPNF
jgi:hypothetical protein